MSKIKRIAYSTIITTAIFIAIVLLCRYGYSILPAFLQGFIDLVNTSVTDLMETTPILAVIILLGLVFLALFSIVAFIFYLLFGISKDYSAEITSLIQSTENEVKKEYLANIDVISWNQISDNLAQRKKLLLEELKAKYGKTNKKNISFIESSVESRWKEIESLLRSKKDSSNHAKVSESEEYLDELFGEDDAEAELETLELSEDDESKVVAYSIPIEADEGQAEKQVSEKIDEIEEAGDFEELEELEEPEFINPLEVIGELEEIYDFDENNDKTDFDVVEQLEEADENLEELEELVEVEAADEVETVEEVEALDEVEEIEEAEPVEEIEELEEAEALDNLEEIEEIEDAEEVEEIEELEEIDYKDPYPELLVNLQAKPVYAADSNLTFISSLNDNFANVENIFAEDLTIGTEYLHELRIMESTFTFVPVKLEFVIDNKSIDEPLPVGSEACFSLTKFNENQQDAVELEEDSSSAIIEVGGVFSIAEDLSYEGIQQDQSFKALVNSVIGTVK